MSKSELATPEGMKQEDNLATVAVLQNDELHSREYPKDGLRAWSVVAGACCSMICTFGATTSFGVSHRKTVSAEASLTIALGVSIILQEHAVSSHVRFTDLVDQWDTVLLAVRSGEAWQRQNEIKENIDGA